MATALVTGGTSGIGAAFARQLAARGTDLVLVARDQKRLDAMARELHSHSGINVETLVADLADPSDAARVAARLEDPAHPIDLLVNNAGSGVRESLTSTDLSHHEHAFNVMSRAVFVLGAAAGRAMRGRGGGAIINISSLQTYLATGSYAAVKAWVTAYSESLAVELRSSGVRVTVVLPGWVRTEWHERAGGRRSSMPDFLWTEPDVVARVALRDSARGKVISIPTVRYRVLGWFARHLPRRAIRRISASIAASRGDAIGAAGGSEHPVVKADGER
jgi:short-subunit dehydrogenase